MGCVHWQGYWRELGQFYKNSCYHIQSADAKKGVIGTRSPYLDLAQHVLQAEPAGFLRGHSVPGLQVQLRMIPMQQCWGQKLLLFGAPSHQCLLWTADTSPRSSSAQQKKGAALLQATKELCLINIRTVITCMPNALHGLLMYNFEPCRASVHAASAKAFLPTGGSKPADTGTLHKWVSLSLAVLAWIWHCVCSQACKMVCRMHAHKQT